MKIVTAIFNAKAVITWPPSCYISPSIMKSQSFFPTLAVLSLAASLYTACLIDNNSTKVGESYLQSQGLRIEQKLDSLSIEIPADSMWMDTIDAWSIKTNQDFWAIGNFNGFKASAKLAFKLKLDTNTIESKKRTLDSAMLELLPFLGNTSTTDTSTINRYAALWKNLQGAKIIIKSRVYQSDSTSADSDSLSSIYDQVLIKNDSLAGLDAKVSGYTSVFSIDTCTLDSTLYSSSITAKKVRIAPKNLIASLKVNPAESKSIFLEILPSNWDDSSWAFFSKNDSLRFYFKSDTAYTKAIGLTYHKFKALGNSSRYSMHTSLQSPPSSMLNGQLISPLNQSVWFRLSRSRLVSALNAAGLPSKIDTANHGYNLQYYIPKANLQIPVVSDSASIFSGTSVPLMMRNTLDTLRPDLAKNPALIVALRAKDSSIMVLDSRSQKEVSRFIFGYQKTSQNKYYVSIKDTISNDTSYYDTLWIGLHQTYRLTLKQGFEVWLSGTDSAVNLNIELSVKDFSRLSSYRFTKGDTTLRLEVATAIQRMLNLADTTYRNDFKVSIYSADAPLYNAFADEGATKTLSLPAFARIPLALNAQGKPILKIKLYYLPLRK